jgi:hypothetical protein
MKGIMNSNPSMCNMTAAIHLGWLVQHGDAPRGVAGREHDVNVLPTILQLPRARTLKLYFTSTARSMASCSFTSQH